MNELSDTIIETINEAAESALEYAEKHTDAGDGYAHMPREGGWCYNNCDDKLTDFLESNEIPMKGLSLDDIAELVLDNFEMVAGHVFSSPKDEILVIGSYPVQSIEERIALEYIRGMTQLHITPKRLKVITDASRNLDSHIIGIDNDSITFEILSDGVWSAQISASDLKELIEDSQE